MNLRKYLCCPVCKDNLSDLFCNTCEKEFIVKDGVPIFIDHSSLPFHLQGQITYFENEKIVASEEYHLDPWQRKYVERFLDNMPSVSGKLLVDCGTGSGYMAIELAKRGAYVIATDLSLRSVIRLRRIADGLGLADRVLSVCSTAEALPIRTKSVSALISNAVLEHIQDESLALSEINRVSEEGGNLMLAVPLAYRYLNPLLLPLNWIHDKRIGHLRRYDQESISRKFDGWAIKKTYYTGHTLKVFKTIINFVHPIFDLELVEAQDCYLIDKKWYASNIICFLTQEGEHV
jgi:ubiquinone/menaquinone biosynthesis C-methylase UbiE